MTVNDTARGRELVASGKYVPCDGRVPGPAPDNGLGRADSAAPDETGARVLDDVAQWLARFIRVAFDGDIVVITLWTVHTHLALELYTTPRLQLDSTMPGSGKTTVLDHLARLCHHPVQAASLSSSALLVRLLENGVRTVLIDEVDRTLRPDSPVTPDLLAIINAGYRVGAVRPVLVPVKGGGWESREMSTYAPVAMAGNAPNLPDDTKSRCIRVLLMPDFDGSVEDSDWELIEPDAAELAGRIADFADQVRGRLKGMQVDLPAGCIGRSKERWRPLKRVAVVAGGRWPALVDDLIRASVAEEAAERDSGLRNMPPGIVLLTDLYAVWPPGDGLVQTDELVRRLIERNTDYWGPQSSYGKQLSVQRFGKLASQVARVTSQRPGGSGPRGYRRSQFANAWRSHRIGQDDSGSIGDIGETGDIGGDNGSAVLGATDVTGLTGSTNVPGVPTGLVAVQPLLIPLGPDRCTECGFHEPTQGHRTGCQQAGIR